MGKPRKVKKKYNYDTNRKRLYQKQKKQPTFQCSQIKEAWDEEKTVQQNMAEMGLASNPNKTLGVPSTKNMIGPKKKKKSTGRMDKTPLKSHVVKGMEEEANTPQTPTFSLSDPEVRFCIQMMEKYGEDYKAMAKDYRNYYQDTPKQIKHKINQFKSIPEQYNEYLLSKQQQLTDTSTTS